MNILLIGNGFDLAHGLPTRYTDFLIFCEMILKVIEISKVDKTILKNRAKYERWINDFNSKMFANCTDAYDTLESSANEIFCSEQKEKIYRSICRDCLENNFYSSRSIKELSCLLYRNFWVEYFRNDKTYQKENWIDFENEIRKVIVKLDFDMHENVMDDDIVNQCNSFLRDKYSKFAAKNKETGKFCVEITFKDIRDELLDALNKFIRAFEVYLSVYIEKMDIRVILPDIRDIVKNQKEVSSENTKNIVSTYCKVINFNYTNTYERTYFKNNEVNFSEIVDYIHGEAKSYNTINSNNMVLGIDEYLLDDRKNKDVEFIAFKKYFQRIHKETGCKYKEWLDEIMQDVNEYKERVRLCGLELEQNQGNGPHGVNSLGKMRGLKEEKKKHIHHLYIFGHSLDVTDGDILREFILTDHIYTTIYYKNMDQKGQQIANLVKVIGQDELIRRTGGGSARTIEFKKQRFMVIRR